jgi:hypothetical protein
MISLYIGADVKSTRANIAPKRPSITRSLFRRPPAIEHTFGIPKPRTTGAGGAPAREIPVDQTAWNVHDTNMWPSIALFL